MHAIVFSAAHAPSSAPLLGALDHTMRVDGTVIILEYPRLNKRQLCLRDGRRSAQPCGEA
jgi:hypothetical protein